MERNRSLTKITCLMLPLLAACATPIGTTPPQRAPTPAEPGAERTVTTTPAQPSQDIAISSVSPEAIEQFRIGRELVDALRPDEANEYFKKALALDPNFAQAHAYLGIHLPGPEGQMELDRAFELSKVLSEAERTLVQMIVADKRGDMARAQELTRKLVALMPGYWRAHEYLGTRASDAGRLDEANIELGKAIELNPKSAVLRNEMGYVLLRQGKKDEAIQSFQKYTELASSEPNAYDSLGDALLAASRFDDAEKAYQKAAELVPRFYVAWQGVAAARALRGDWKGSYDALTKARAAAVQPAQKLQNDEVTAMTQLAEGRGAEALKTIDAAALQATKDKLLIPAASAQLAAAYILIETDKPRDAVERIAKALSTIAAEKGKRAVRTRMKAQILKATAYQRLSQKSEVTQILTALQADLADQMEDDVARSTLRYVEGLLALTGGNLDSAVGHFGTCNAQLLYCKYREALARESVGDTTGAEGAKRRLLDTPTRDPEFLYVRARMTGEKKR